MVSDEERVGQSGKARSSLRRRLAECGLARSIVPATGPRSGRLVPPTARTLDLPSLPQAAAAARSAAKGVPSASILCRTTASFLASATLALPMPARRASRAARQVHPVPARS